MLVGGSVAASPPVAAPAEPVSFARDVRPILLENCFVCHGPDEASRMAGLRLDRPEGLFETRESGVAAIVPGDPESSALIARVTSDDPSTRMPPAGAGYTLSAEQIATLRRWIASGADYEAHWSFQPLRPIEPPSVRDAAWPRNAIDHFVLARLEAEGLRPSAEARRATLLRRLSLDLLGLPAQPAEIAEFLADTSPDAYERVVERLLASPHFGERWGRHWLDLAHYADSDGYLNDDFRPYAYLYRDWVIEAINNDLPFDQFTVEQLAGDLLPDATLSQRTATGFLRNSLRNIEAGVDLEEYRLKGLVDRISTVGIGWLGLTVGCAECHSHKYEPITQREFFELFAFLNDADDVDVPATSAADTDRHRADKRAWQLERQRSAAAIEAMLAEAVWKAVSFDRNALLAGGDLQQLRDGYQKLSAQPPQPPDTKAMTVAQRQTPRDTYVHLRGNYRDRGALVEPATPHVLPPLSSRGQRADRLDLARWLVDPANPLTPRVAVNHIWKHLLGRGLVATPDNFGLGGELPSHPELLDWLAGEFVRRGWSRKEVIRLIVHSATYRQSAQVRDDLEQRDPLNVLLARQSRLRLEAEVIRDSALAAAGLLEPAIGGPGIRPPQPTDVASISRNVAWEVSPRPDVYRRGLYIVLRRATPYPMLMTFDMPDSSVACAQRERTNSPLQALTLLNDPVFVECAQALGRELASDARRSFDQRLQEAFLRCLNREPRPAEIHRMRSLFDQRLARLTSQTQAAREILGPAEVVGHEAAEQAAWVLVARVLMNLDEFITRE